MKNYMTHIFHAIPLLISLFQYKLRRLIESIIFRMIIALLFIADLIIIIISIAQGKLY